MDQFVCGICTEELGSEEDVCCLPCGHVKHFACLREWCKKDKKCPNCRKYIPHLNFRKLYFDKETETSAVDNETSTQSGTALNTNHAVNQDLDKCKADLEAAQKRALNLEESNRQLETKLQNSEAQLRQSFEIGQQQIVTFRTSEANNRELLEGNRSLEQQLCSSKAKIQDLEAKLTQTDLGQVIALLKEKVGKLENGEIARLKNLHDAAKTELEVERRRRRDLSERILKLGAEVTKLTSENAKVKQDLSDYQKRLAMSEKRNADANKEKETMAERNRNYNFKMKLFQRKLCDDVNKFVCEMSQEIEEPKSADNGNLPHLMNLTRSAIVEIPPILKRRTLKQESGSNNGSPKKPKPNEPIDEIIIS
ncbi:ring finger domain-containing protein [Ditylenchus destructor]|nr:ring finger domain-containing protein [Ditylenchus destructor]